jgi:photosystem II stability/assembly factor-like uncharacterized protein
MIAGIAVLLHGSIAADSQRGGTTAAPKPADAKFKAIWEPVNVPEDIDLLSVHFVSPEEGWVAGGTNAMAGGVIFHTADGGETWDLQLGDPASSDRAVSDLQFLDATHGFAVQGTPSTSHTLLSTSDGKSWIPTGTVPEHRYALFFTSASTGFVADPNRRILRTTDGGKKWQPVYTCRIKTEIAGLMREADCYIYGIHFPTPSVGYAIGGPLPENAGNVLAKTEDGGATWNAWVVLPGESAQESSLHFLDANNGVFRAKDQKMYRTADGGKTWTGVSGQAELKSELSFAGDDAGWMIYYRRMTYTSNGGRSWLSREINFPAMVQDSFLAAADRGYAVGEHGMVYRYRIVPIDYMAKGMLPAPALR